jgi:hypothetical protein
MNEISLKEHITTLFDIKEEQNKEEHRSLKAGIDKMSEKLDDFIKESNVKDEILKLEITKEVHLINGKFAKIYGIAIGVIFIVNILVRYI